MSQPKPPILLKNVTLVQRGQMLPSMSVLLDAGIVVEVAQQITALPPGTVERDCSGKILFPGLFDMQAHLNEPGREDRETLESGCKAALRGGITGLVMMPDTSPCVDSGVAVESLANAATGLPIQLLVSGTVSKGRRGEELAELGAMRDHKAVLMTDAPRAVDNPLLMRRALDYAKNLGILIASSCDLSQLSASGSMNEGHVSYRLGLPGIAACGEEIALVRDLRLAQSVDGRIHINQISTRGSVETVVRYKNNIKQKVPRWQFTVGVTPHHLIFTEEALVSETNPYDTNFKVNPPLRTEKDRVELIEALRDGYIDVISTDHSPFTISEKEREFDGAPFGMTGLETSLVAIYHYLIHDNQLDWQTLVRAFSENPRAILHQDPVFIGRGEKVNAVLFNPAGQTSFETRTRASKSSNTPFMGQTLRGRVERVFLGTADLDPHA